MTPRYILEAIVISRMARLFILFSYLLAAVIILPGSLFAQTSEYDIKAQFIYNIMRMTEWKDTNIKKQGMVLCTIGADPFHSAFDKIIEKTSDMKLTLKRNIVLSDAERCNALYVSDSEKKNLGRILRKTEGQPILTFSDIGGFVDSKGMVGFIDVEGKIRFEINMASVNSSDIRLSAKLLELSRRIVR